MFESMQNVSLAALIVSSHCLLLAIALFFSYSGHRLANRILSALLFIEAIRLFCIFVVSETKDFDSHFINQLILLRLTYGPLLYLYTRTVIEDSPGIRRKDMIHLVPFFGVGVLAYLNQQLSYVVSLETQALSVGVIILISFIAYSAVCIYKVKQHKNKIIHQLSAIEEVSLNWLRLLSIYLMVVASCYALFAICYPFLPYGLGQMLVMTLVTGGLFCYLFAFLGLKQRPIYENLPTPMSMLREERIDGLGNKTFDSANENESDIADTGVAHAKNPKYSSSDLSRADAEHFYKQLLQLMEDEKIYLVNGLKIQQLANKIGLHVPQISQIINQCSGANFYDFVNNYRVEAAMKILRSSSREKLSMISMAEQVGFNSTSTFYKHFKKMTGCSPKQYVRALSE